MEKVIRLSFDSIKWVLRSVDKGTQFSGRDDGQIEVQRKSVKGVLVEWHKTSPSHVVMDGVEHPSAQSSDVCHRSGPRWKKFAGCVPPVPIIDSSELIQTVGSDHQISVIRVESVQGEERSRGWDEDILFDQPHEQIASTKQNKVEQCFVPSIDRSFANHAHSFPESSSVTLFIGYLNETKGSGDVE